MSKQQQTPFRIERFGVIMEGNPRNPAEAMGVLNPAACRGRDGELYLFPRVVAAGNYSRIGLGRVRFDGAGDPSGVERLGYALEPKEGFERNERTAGVEDPRVTFIPALDLYIMTYTAYGPLGPRIALAQSSDLLTWQRIGPVQFSYEPEYHTDFNLYTNKDALLFPEPVRAPDGELCLALLHRPTYNVSWRGHRLLAAPEQPWEALKIGGGTPPVRTALGWLTLFHGVSGRIVEGVDLQPDLPYVA